MKIAITWNDELSLRRSSFPFEQYRRGFEALGHDAFVLARREATEGFPGPVQTVEDLDSLCDPDTWRALGADVAMIITWHRMPAVLEAIRRAGTRVLAIADTDGQIGLRVHPWPTLEKIISYADGWSGKARCVKYWLGRYLREAAGADEDEEYLASTRNSDAVVVASSEARHHLLRFLAHRDAAHLGRRVVTVPYTIAPEHLSCPLPESRDDRLIAIGRWDNPQKNAGLLAGALAVFLAARPATEVVIFGAGGDRWFAPLAERFVSFSYRGLQPPDEVARALSTSRAVVISSRWESGPLVALEGLALGATIVGTPIPSLVSWSENGRFGTVAKSSRPAALARALSHETDAWDEGRRDPELISRHWRSRLEPRTVCRRMLAALPGDVRSGDRE